MATAAVREASSAYMTAAVPRSGRHSAGGACCADHALELCCENGHCRVAEEKALPAHMPTRHASLRAAVLCGASRPHSYTEAVRPVTHVTGVDSLSDDVLSSHHALVVPSSSQPEGLSCKEGPEVFVPRLRAYVRSGSGLVDFGCICAFRKMRRIGGPLFTDVAEAMDRSVMADPFTVVDHGHPVMHDIPAEFFSHLPFLPLRPGRQGRALCIDAFDRPVVVVAELGAGRMVEVGFQLGPDQELEPNDPLRRLLANSVQWAAGGKPCPEQAAGVVHECEKLRFEVGRLRRVYAAQIQEAAGEMETVIEQAGFALGDRCRLPAVTDCGISGTAVERLRIALSMKTNTARKRLLAPFDAVLHLLDLPPCGSSENIERSRALINTLPGSQISDGADPHDLFDALDASERERFYLPEVKALRDALSRLCAPAYEALSLRDTRGHATSPARKDINAAELGKTFLLSMHNGQGLKPPGTPEAIDYLGHYGFNMLETQAYVYHLWNRIRDRKGLERTLARLEPAMQRNGLKQILWPIIWKEGPAVPEIGDMPENPDVLNPDMLAWRKRNVTFCIDVGRHYGSFLGLQFDEILPEDSLHAARLQPSKLNKEQRQRVTPAFRSYLLDKYGSAGLERLGLDHERIRAPLPDDRRGRKVLWMEYQEFLGDRHVEYWQKVYEYAHSLKNDVVVWRLVNHPRFCTATFCCRWSRLTESCDVIDSAIWLAGAPCVSFFLELLRANAKGPSIMTSANYQGHTTETYRRTLAMTLAHSQGNHIFSWRSHFKRRHSIQAGVPVDDQPEMWRIIIEHAEFVRRTERCLVDTTSAAKVALGFSERDAMLFDHFDSAQEAPRYVANQAGLYDTLSHAHIQCDPVFLDTMTPERLEAYGVLVLSGGYALKNEALQVIREWVAAGGYLIATGGVSLADRWGVAREDYWLNDVFGASHVAVLESDGPLSFRSRGADVQCNAVRYDKVKLTEGRAVCEWQKEGVALVTNRFGKGQCLLLTSWWPGLSMTSRGDMRMPGMPGRYPQFFPGFKDFLARIVQDGLESSGVSLPLRAHGCPGRVEITMRRQPAHRRRIIHLINHSLKDRPVPRFQLSVRTDTTSSTPRVFYARDGLDIRNMSHGKDLEFDVRPFNVYEMVVVED